MLRRSGAGEMTLHCSIEARQAFVFPQFSFCCAAFARARFGNL
jgi:hypothetical protein